jgi:hypothetical protein
MKTRETCSNIGISLRSRSIERFGLRRSAKKLEDLRKDKKE